MGGLQRTPPGGRPDREEHGGQEGQGLQTPTRVRKPTVRFSPSPPASTLVSLGRPKFQRRRGAGGQSQDFLGRMAQEVLQQELRVEEEEEGPGEEAQEQLLHSEDEEEVSTQ